MKKTVQSVLALLLLTCIYRYARIAGTVSFVQKTEGENCVDEMDEKTEKEIISKMKVTAGGVMEITEISWQMTKEGETRETRNLKYPYFTWDKSREINSQIYEWPRWKVLMEEAMEQDRLRVQLLKENVELEGEEGRHYLQNHFINLFGKESNPGRENVSFFIKDGYLFFIMYPDWKGDTFVKWEVPLDMAELEARREPEKVEESDMPGLYQKLVESAQLDWEWVIEPGEYEDFMFLGGKYIAVKKGNGWGFIDMYGTMIVPCQYDEVKDYSDGLAAVKKDGKWGYIDKEGQVAIELMYDDAGSFSEGKAPVERNDYYQDGLEAWAYIDSKNTVVIDWFPRYGGAAFRKYVGEFHDGFAFVLRDIPTIINENGEEVFDSYFFINDYVYDSKYKAIPAYVFTDDLMTEKKYGLVGVDGNCLLEPIFDWIWEPCGDYVRVEMIVEGERCEGAIRIKEKE